MGGFVGTVGKYRLFAHDSFSDYIKDKQPLSYYENYKIGAEFYINEHRNRDDIVDIEIPLSVFMDFYKLRKNYSFKWKEGDVLSEYLFNYVTKKLKERVFEYVFINERYAQEDLEKNCKKFNNVYYLHTPIGVEEIILKPEPLKHRIKRFSQYRWLACHGLETYYKTFN